MTLFDIDIWVRDRKRNGFQLAAWFNQGELKDGIFYLDLGMLLLDFRDYSCFSITYRYVDAQTAKTPPYLRDLPRGHKRYCDRSEIKMTRTRKTFGKVTRPLTQHTPIAG